ncbi:MAG: alpha/beta fold hydrolase, partial [Verrucomicrobia bacterium]|nr:alpha/beta fold hydrolase [Verrucomicrobiota bacterium]
MANVAESTGTFAAGDGTRMFYRAWIPAIRPIATALIIHGLGEHSGRYLHVGRYFSENAIRTFALDLRGHGQSGGKPMFIRNYGELSMDLVNAIERFADVPLFLLGHSFGAQLLLWTMRNNPPFVRGLIVSAPWLGLVRRPPRWQTAFVESLNRRFPGIRIATGIRPEQLSSDQAHLETLRDPVFSRGYITVR